MTLPTYDNSLYLTGVYDKGSDRKSAFVVKLSYQGELIQFHKISSQIDLYGVTLNPFMGVVNNEQVFVFGEAGVRGFNLNALGILYDFSSKKIINSVVLSGKDVLGNSAGLSFRTSQVIGKNGPANLVGGLALFRKDTSTVSGALISVIDQNLKVSLMKSVRSSDVEEVIDMTFKNSVFFVSPMRYNNNLDVLAVKLNTDLQIENASCVKSFLSDVEFAGVSLLNPSVDTVSVKVYDIKDLKMQEALNSQIAAAGTANNVCSKP